jgi:hypothetical protein
MKKGKWYNWVGDPIWDDYCKVAWLLIFIPALIFFGLLAIGLITGAVEVVA